MMLRVFFNRPDGRVPHLRFRYVNWKGIEHEYFVEPESIEFGPYSKSGLDRALTQAVWVLHGKCIRRNGERREDEPRRTFIMDEMVGVEVFQ